MTERPKLRVTRAVVAAARAEVAAFEAAGIADQIDPMVRRIAEATTVPTSATAATPAIADPTP